MLGILAAEAGLSLVERSALLPPVEPDGYRTYRREKVAPRARIVPFYLPQFHPIPENDRWWGRRVHRVDERQRGTAALSRVTTSRAFRAISASTTSGVDQVRRDQLSLASASGVSGFMYYYYWFGGRRLLEAPIEALLASDITQPFCLMWANENWTRRWDGRESDLLIGQDYDHVPAEISSTTCFRFLVDDRYMTIGGRKIVAVYRPARFPDCATSCPNGDASARRRRGRAVRHERRRRRELRRDRIRRRKSGPGRLARVPAPQPPLGMDDRREG